MKIYTKIGDQGDTVLGDGSKTKKDNLRVQAYGNLDELNSFLGLVIATTKNDGIVAPLEETQRKLFAMGAVIANPKLGAQVLKGEELTGAMAKANLKETDVATLEALIDDTEEKLSPLKTFILPGGHEIAARLHLARTVCRRAERSLVQLHQQHEVPPLFLKYLNRLSDLLFVLARLENQIHETTETPW